MISYSIYIHIPFCTHRCGYCDFNTYAGLQKLIPDYVNALCREIKQLVGEGHKLPIHTIFFGGGTPSLLPIPELAHIIHAIHDRFHLSDDIEMTLEANPGSLSSKYLQDLRDLGINRLSLGMQSANPEELRLLERQHDFLDVIHAVTWARQAGFDNINLDLIYGLPGQQLSTWKRTIDLALGLSTEHFSLYALTLEHGMPLANWAARGLLVQPDPDVAAEMYEWAKERLAIAGYVHYEISNWAQQTRGRLHTCHHNLQYWRNLAYLGFGAGAHGYAGGYRTANVLSPAVYIQRLSDPNPRYLGDGQEVQDTPLRFPMTLATQNAQMVDRQVEMGETMMMGLRLVQEGVSEKTFQSRFGQSLQECFGPQIKKLISFGLLEWAGETQDILRLTTRGHLLGNRAFLEFV